MRKKYFGMAPAAFTPFSIPKPTHPFEGSPADDYKCAHCGKPRALHHDPKQVIEPTQEEPRTPETTL